MTIMTMFSSNLYIWLAPRYILFFSNFVSSYILVCVRVCTSVCIWISGSHTHMAHTIMQYLDAKFRWQMESMFCVCVYVMWFRYSHTHTHNIDSSIDETSCPGITWSYGWHVLDGGMPVDELVYTWISESHTHTHTTPTPSVDETSRPCIAWSCGW